MTHRLERLGIWLSFTVGGVALLVGANAWHPNDPAALGVLYVLGCALLAIGVLGFASEIVVAVHGYLPGSTPVPRTALPVSTVPEVLAAPPRPADSDKPPKRVFVPPSVTPQFLADIFNSERTFAQNQLMVAPYVGKWLRLAGPVSDVNVMNTATTVTVSWWDKDPNMLMPLTAKFWFVGESRDIVGLLNRDDQIQAIGRIDKVWGREIELRDGELVGSPAAPSPVVSLAPEPKAEQVSPPDPAHQATIEALRTLVQPPRPAIRPPVLAGVPGEYHKAKIDEYASARSRLTTRAHKLRGQLWALRTDEGGVQQWSNEVKAFTDAFQEFRVKWWAGDPDALAPVPVAVPDPILVPTPYWRAELASTVEAHIAWLVDHDASDPSEAPGKRQVSGTH